MLTREKRVRTELTSEIFDFKLSAAGGMVFNIQFVSFSMKIAYLLTLFKRGFALKRCKIISVKVNILNFINKAFLRIIFLFFERIIISLRFIFLNQ